MSNFRSLTLCALCSLWLVLASGCRIERPPQVNKDFGPTVSMAQLVQRINSNAEQVPTLRGEGHFQAWIREKPEANEQYIAGDVTMLYTRPRSMRFIGKDPILGPVVEIASNDERYWVIVKPPNDRDKTMWWGNHASAARVDPSTIPVRPDLLLEVLGVGTIPTNFLEPPVPVMRFNSDKGAYMLVWSVPTRDRWVAVKEIWYDRKTYLPTVVVLYDENGRTLLRAYLLDHRPVEVEGTPKDQWPKVAREYRLFFPQTQSTLKFDLRGDLQLKKRNVPNAASFAFPDPDVAGVSRVINLDEQTGP